MILLFQQQRLHGSIPIYIPVPSLILAHIKLQAYIDGKLVSQYTSKLIQQIHTRFFVEMQRLDIKKSKE